MHKFYKLLFSTCPLKLLRHGNRLVVMITDIVVSMVTRTPSSLCTSFRKLSNNREHNPSRRMRAYIFHIRAWFVQVTHHVTSWDDVIFQSRTYASGDVIIRSQICRWWEIFCRGLSRRTKETCKERWANGWKNYFYNCCCRQFYLNLT